MRQGMAENFSKDERGHVHAHPHPAYRASQ